MGVVDLSNTKGQGFRDLLEHAGHEIECATYEDAKGHVWNVALECRSCETVLVDFNHPEVDEAIDMDDDACDPA